jgi:hypothetical protein
MCQSNDNGRSLQNATATGNITGNKLNRDVLSGDNQGYSASYVRRKRIAMVEVNCI